MKEEMPQTPFRSQRLPTLAECVPGVKGRGLSYRGFGGPSARDSQPGQPDLSSGLGDRRKSIFLEFFLVQ